VSSATQMIEMFFNAEVFDQVLCWKNVKAGTNRMFTGAKGGRIDSKC